MHGSQVIINPDSSARASRPADQRKLRDKRVHGLYLPIGMATAGRLAQPPQALPARSRRRIGAAVSCSDRARAEHLRHSGSRDLCATASFCGAYRHRRSREHLFKGHPQLALARGARRRWFAVARLLFGIWVLVVFGLDPDTRRLPRRPASSELERRGRLVLLLVHCGGGVSTDATVGDRAGAPIKRRLKRRQGTSTVA